ncbi:MAG: hypothetical protein ABEL97_03540 [Salinibacter sp.]
MLARSSAALIALVLVLGSTAPVAAQPSGTVSIRGSVVDDSTGAPLPDTHVFVSGSMNGTTVWQGVVGSSNVLTLRVHGNGSVTVAQSSVK